jgi:tetratricopeptide (TPR) repeat protein
MKGLFQVANASYNAYLRNFKGKAFLKDVYLKLFFSNYLAGEDKKSLAFLSKIPVTGSATSETDKAAEKFYENYAKTHILPNKALLQARLALDGGYNTQALDAIKEVDTKQITLKEQAEYFFLGGKAFYRTGQHDKAITYFEKSIALSEKQVWHFGASSSLQIGYILQGKGQKLQAKNYFEKAISYKNHEFKNTIDSKARAAMTEMGYYL